MSLISEKKIIDVYHNSKDLKSFYTILAHDLQCDLIFTSWFIIDNVWVIPGIYHKDKYNNNNGKGWYIQGKPEKGFLPINVDFKINLYEHNFNSKKKILVFDKKKELSLVYYFIIESFLDQLIAADKEDRYIYKKKLLLSNICHSIRTPLNGILHTTNMLMINNEKEENISLLKSTNRDHMNNLNKSAISLANNIFSIVDVTKLSLDRLDINNDVFNIKELINEIIETAHLLNKKDKVKIISDIDEKIQSFGYNDRRRIKQILVNLIDTSIHTTDYGTVTITAKSITTTNNNFRLFVQIDDTGVGMNEETSSNLFKAPELYYRNKQYGTNMRFNYLLAKKLGGELKLLYSKPNHGSSFLLELNMTSCKTPKFNTKSLIALGGKKVLVIDSSDNKIYLCKCLDKFGIIYTVASSNDEVTILHVEKKYDLIICHANVTTSDGILLVKHLRSIWPNSLFMGIFDDTSNTPTILFHDTFTYPIEEYTIRNKLLKIFNNDKKKDIVFCVNILIVEDEYINRVVLKKQLKNIGYSNIDIANNGCIALEKIKKKQYDVLLVDIRMPLMDGFELADKVHEYSIKNIKKCPIMIGVTAQIILCEEIKPYFCNFLQKPVDMKLLHEKIQSLLI